MAQGPRLTKEHNNYIAKVYHQNPNWVAKQVRDNFRYHFKPRGDWPGLSAIQKALAKLRDLDKKRSWEQRLMDEPSWSLGSLVEYPIPPEAMPVVMSVYKKSLVKKEKFTIRQALWIGRLFKIIKNLDLVEDWAYFYAFEEWLSEVSNQPINTEELDSKLINDVNYAQRQLSELDRELTIYDIAQKYGCDPVKLQDLNLSIEETEEIARKEAQNERSRNQEIQE